MKIKLAATVAFFTIIYGLISGVNHYLFRTSSLDLGYYTHISYMYSNFKIANCSMILNSTESALSGHFDVYLMLFAPFVNVFGSYTLLVIQLLSLVLGGIGVYAYFNYTNTNTPAIAYWAMVYFYLFYGIYAALSFDYHSVVVAASIVPWFMLYLHKQHYILATLFFILLLLGQENMALFAAFIALGLLVAHYKNKMQAIALTAYAAIALIYFIAVTQYFMPSLSASHTYNGFLYKALGNTISQAFVNTIKHPFNAFVIAFTNHTPNIDGNFVKLETYLFLLASGIYFLARKPYFLVMLIPLFVQKMFHNNVTMWGVSMQYSVEFAPVLAIGIFTVISNFKTTKAQAVGIGFAVIGALVGTIHLMDNTIGYNNTTNLRLYKAEHYTKEYNVSDVNCVLNTLPKQASVSAQAVYVPHLALRTNIYQFPIVNDADYIVFSTQENSYPLTKASFDTAINSYLTSNKWSIYAHNAHFYVLNKTAR
jgi:uncharacterized membrane protein